MDKMETRMRAVERQLLSERVPVQSGVMFVAHTNHPAAVPCDDSQVGEADEPNAAGVAPPAVSTIAQDTAYWVKLDREWIPEARKGRGISWCMPGMPIGIYKTGAGSPSTDALAVCVVTSQPSSLEKCPFVDADDLCVAIAIQGAVPLRMAPDVLRRFYKGGKKREFYWTDQGVDFVDEKNESTLDKLSAKFIGDAEFCKDLFDANGELRDSFQGVRGLRVLVNYRAITMTQFSAVVAKVRDVASQVAGIVHQVRREMYFVAILVSVIVVITTLPLLRMIEWKIQLFLSGRAPPTTVSLNMPSNPSSFYDRPHLCSNITNTVLDSHFKAKRSPELHTPVVVIRAPGGFGKSTLAVALVQQKAVWKWFPGGVYFLDCSYSFGSEKSLIMNLASQMFSNFIKYDDVRDLVRELKIHIAERKKDVLVLLDNVANASIVQHMADAVGNEGILVVTTREKALYYGAKEIVINPLRDDEVEAFLAVHAVSKSEQKNTALLKILDRVQGVPISLSIVSKLRTVVEYPWEEIFKRIDAYYGDININGMEPWKFGIRSEHHTGVYACIAVSVDALNERLRQRFIPLMLLPVGQQVSSPVVGAIWQEEMPYLDLKTLNDHSLLSLSTTSHLGSDVHHVVSLHDMVRSFLENRVRTNSTERNTTQAALNSVASYVVSPSALEPVLTQQKDLISEIGVYFRHFAHLTAQFPPNATIIHPPVVDLVSAHAKKLHDCCSGQLIQAQYSVNSTLAVRALGKADPVREMPLLQEALANVEAVLNTTSEATSQLIPPERTQLLAWRAEIIDKIADLTTVRSSNRTLVDERRMEALQLYERALKLKREALGAASVPYTRTLNSIGLTIEQLLLTHLEYEPNNLSGFNQTLLQRAFDVYGEARELLQTLCESDKAAWFRIGVNLNNVARLNTHLNKNEEALQFLEEAITYYRRSEELMQAGTDPKFIINAEANIGITLYHLGEYGQAKLLLTQAHEYFVNRHFSSTHTYIVKTKKYLELIQAQDLTKGTEKKL